MDIDVPVDDLDYLHEFNSATATWTRHQLQGRHPPGVYNGGCATIDDCMYFCGGGDERGQYTGSLYQLNLTNWTWQEMSSPGASGSPNVMYSMIDYKSSLLVQGERDEHVKLTNDHGGMYARGRLTIDLHIFDIVTGESKLS